MRSQTRYVATRAAFLASAFVVAACSDRAEPVGPPLETDPPPLEAVRIACRAQVREQTVTCGQQGLSGGASALIVGNQGVYVQVTTSGASYTVGTGDFEFDVTVQNLIPQAMATTDGTTGTADGVRLFFQQAPTVTSGVGAITVVNEDGTGTFTAAGQDYFQYSGAELGGDGILSTNETSSAQNWVFNMPATVLTFDFTLFVAADVQFPDGYIDVTPPVDSLVAGSAQALTGTVRSAVGNVIPGQVISWGTGNAGIATVDGSGNVTGVAPGTVTITATSGARSGSASIAVCPNLALGGVYVADMPAGSSFCLGGLAGGAEYTVVPVNVAASGSQSLSVTGSGIIAVSGPPTPSRLFPAGPRLNVTRGPARDDAWEWRLRHQERRELRGLAPVSGGGLRANRVPGGPGRAITPGVPSVGALMNLNVETDNSCGTNDIRVGRVEAVGTNVIVMADTMNPAGGLSAAQYAAIADSFDTFIHPVITGNFGTPSDIDSNSRVIAFYTRAVNELTPPASSSFVGGFFFSRDLFSAGSCPTSNVGEMFYMLAADPAGTVNGNVRSVSFILEQTLGTLAHEFEHLINASRRMHVNTPFSGDFEEVWLDEGLAHIAEELIFYNQSGLGPDANLDVGDVGAVQDDFFKYAESNFGRMRQWLLNPLTSGPFQEDDDLATRGASWSFMRYSADRVGGTESAFWGSLINTQETGLTNVEDALGTDPLPWYRDWAAAMYADDAAGSPPAIYTQPSWNFRDIYAALDYAPGPSCSCAYELAVRNPSNGVADAFSVVHGAGAAYLRMGVSASAFAGVTVLSGGVAPPGTTRLAVIRRE